jgi:hypothetical protein
MLSPKLQWIIGKMLLLIGKMEDIDLFRDLVGASALSKTELYLGMEKSIISFDVHCPCDFKRRF